MQLGPKMITDAVIDDVNDDAKLQPCFVAVALGHTEQAQAHVCFAEQGK